MPNIIRKNQNVECLFEKNTTCKILKKKECKNCKFYVEKTTENYHKYIENIKKDIKNYALNHKE